MKGKIIDYTGIKIGNITILSLVKRQNGKSYWNCRCDCGNEYICEIHNTKDRIEKHGQKYCKKCRPLSRVTHGDGKKFNNRKVRLYSIWQGMLARCDKKYATHYDRYGGMGIKVCQEWYDYSVFKKWALENGYADDLSIDRIDGNGNYCPENCRWVTKQYQQSNLKSNIIIEYEGKRLTIIELSKIIKIEPSLIRNRHYKGWSAERIIKTPHRTIAKRCI